MKRPSKHDRGLDCWCEPVTIYTSEATGCRVFAHRGPREPILPPLDVILKAIEWANQDDDVENPTPTIEVP